MKKIILISVAVLLSGVYAYSADVQFTNGSDITAKFLGIEIGARSSSLGDADVTSCNGGEALFVNPANTRPMDTGNSLLISHDSWIGDTYQETLAYTHHFEKYGVGGLGVSYVNEGKLDGYTTDSAGNPVSTGSINPYAMIIKANWSNYLLKQLQGGINIGYIMESIGSSQTHKGVVDIGLKYLDIVNGLNFGASLENFGLSENGYSVDTNILLGLGYNIKIAKRDNINAEVDLKIPYQNSLLIAGGFEYAYSGTLFVRVGYEGDNSDVSGLKGLRLGLGIKYQTINIDYCYEPYGKLGTSNKISLGINF
jgi:hypothetical protein